MTGLDNTKVRWFKGLSNIKVKWFKVRWFKVRWFVKTIIIAKPLTICQIIQKYHQTRVGGISQNHVSRIWSIYRYIGYEGFSKYRRIPPISLYKTLNVSHNGQGAYMGGYIRNTKPFIGIYNTYKAYEVYMV